MQKLIAYLQLCRFAAVFTAMSDIFLGYLLTHAELESPRDFGLLLGSSSCLYLAGMVFNDVFDRQVDAQERPKRPIPSMRVPVRAAVVLGTALVVAGLALSIAVGLNSAVVAGLLTGVIFLYDGVFKSTWVGPVVMGSCRFLNVMLGASTARDSFTEEPSLMAVWTLPQVYVAAAIGVYIAGVTWFARNEAGTSRRSQLAWAMGTINLGFVLLLAFVMNWRDQWGHGSRTLAALALIALLVNFRLVAAFFDPVGAKVQSAIRAMLLWLIMLDAIVVFFVQEKPLYAISMVILMFPARLLARFLAIT